MPTTAVLTQDCERLNTSTPLFGLSLAQNIDDLTACQRLRYQVFNCELGEGLADSHAAPFSRLISEVSGRLCGPPAIDPVFRTIDFLTLVDLHRIPDRVRARFF